MLKILHVVGARPNFMKADPVIRAMKKAGGFRQTLVHTGQHYDHNMSKVFFDDLGMKKPDIDLGVGSGSHAAQTAAIMERFEPVLIERKPDWVFVYGDVNSTVACGLIASKLGVRLAHVESGLRSFDRAMPEEVNRVVVDHIADLLFVTEKSGIDNLKAEGISGAKVKLVGNTMIDSLARLLPEATRIFHTKLKSIGIEPESYVLVTMHRPSNVDSRERLSAIMHQLELVAETAPVFLPLHPRTAKLLGRRKTKVRIIDPLGYLEFIALQDRAAVVVTDSGGIQEETTYLGVPCLTVRANTERPVTIEKGTNRLCKINAISKEVQNALQEGRKGRKGKKPRIPKWDGKAAERIVAVLQNTSRKGTKPQRV